MEEFFNSIFGNSFYFALFFTFLTLILLIPLIIKIYLILKIKQIAKNSDFIKLELQNIRSGNSHH